MENFLFAANAVLPLILLVALGYFLKRINFLSKEFLKNANRFCFFVALPVLLFKNLYDSTLEDMPWKLIIFVIIAIIIIFILSLIYSILFVKKREQKGVMIQGIMRSNYAFIGIPLASALFTSGSAEATKTGMLVALVSIFCIPLFNMLSVIALSLFIDNKVSVKKILINICKNPLIIGIIVGIIVLLFRLLVPESSFFVKEKVTFLYKTMNSIASIASPLALIVLGGQFEFSKVKGMSREIITGVSLRTIVIPTLVFIIAIVLDLFKPTEFAVLVALFSSPVAIASAVMAQEMKNDYVLAGQLVVWTTLISSITIFLAVLILKTLGYL